MARIMDETYFRKISTTILLALLIVLSFLLLKPILLSVIIAFILAFVFNPVYCWLTKIVKNRNISAAIMVILLGIIIVLPFWFLTPIFIDQSFRIYQSAQQMDFVGALKSIFPSLFASDQFSQEVGTILGSFVTRTANSMVNALSKLILDFPKISLQFLVVFFTFFFVLRDKEELIEYIKGLLPFSKDIENKLFAYSKAITMSVIYGQVVIGVVQGLVVGIGFFIFRVPNALLLTLLASLAGIFPIIGTTIVWAPVAIYLFLAGNNFAAIGIIFFGIISSSIDNLIRPIFVSKRTNVHTAVILIGMIGGLFLFGILGFILGPLILSYLLVILELYRTKGEKPIFLSPLPK